MGKMRILFTMKWNGFFLMVCWVFCSSCLSDEQKLLKDALKVAGENRVELEKVLEHYAEDSLKLKAARYLIVNMPYHYTLEVTLVSPTGEKLWVDVSSFQNRGEVYNYCDSLYKQGYQRKVKQIPDIKTLDSDFLIRNIELAFQAWQKPWAKSVSFEDFCHWILPYRLQNEAVSVDFREQMMNHYLPLLDSVGVTTSLEACRVINQRLSEQFRFKDMLSPHYPSLENTYKNGFDACIGLCNLNVFIMRALGIPVSADCTTWTHMNQGHLWPVLFDKGKSYPYDTENKYFTEYVSYLKEEEVRRPAKVYRNRFDYQEKVTDNRDDGFRCIAKEGVAQDVTDKYLIKIQDIQLIVDKWVENTSDLVYLCTYNCRQWQPLAMGYKQGDTCTFKKVAGNNFFIVADSPDGKSLRFITAPFYADTTGLIRKFIPQQEAVAYTFPIESMKIYSYMYLNYWDVNTGKFIKVDYDEISDSTRVYKQIPKNSLLLFLIPKEKKFSDRNRPLFYLDNDTICSTRSDLSH